MTISELIYEHFAGLKGGLKKGTYSPLTMASVKNTVLKSLCSQSQAKNRNYGQDALLPFLDSSIKTTVKEDGSIAVDFVARSLGKIKKDLWQILTSGMFSENLITAKIDSINKYKGKKDEGFKIYSAFADESDYWKTKIETNKTYEKYINLLLLSGEASVEGDELKLEASDIDKSKTFKMHGPSILLATNIHQLNEIAIEKNIEEKIIEPVVYLASLLMLPVLTTKEDIKNKKDFTFELSRKLLPYLYESIDKDIENSTAFSIVDLAVDLANTRIEKLNEVIDDYNKDKSDEDKEEKYETVDSLYYDMKINQLVQQKIMKFQDLPVRWAKDGSNYRWAIVDNSGKLGYLYVADDEKLKTDDIKEVFNLLKSNDEAQILASFEFLDQQIINDGEHDKVVDTFEEVAEILYANLILLSYINKNGGINDENRKNMEQIFTIPLIQCLGNMDKDSIKTIEQKAYNSVRKLFVSAGEGKEFDDNFKYFNHRYNRKKLSEDYLKSVNKIIVTELRAYQNKKETKNGKEKVAETALSKLLPELSLAYKKGIVSALYEGVLPDDFDTKNTSRKDVYKQLYEAIKYDKDVTTGDKATDIYLKILLGIGKSLKEIQELGDKNPDAVLDEQAVKSATKTKKEIEAETKDIIKDILNR